MCVFLFFENFMLLKSFVLYNNVLYIYIIENFFTYKSFFLL